MSLPEVIGVAVGGSLGAPARYAVERAVLSRSSARVPVGTLLVNLSGSLVLGVLLGLTVHHHLGPVAGALLGTGCCGAYTTFSTFSLQSVRLAEDRLFGLAAGYVAVSLVAGFLAALAGYGLGLAL